MKINCDVCEKVEASIFCCADEAALCEDCDRHVHHANKLASKHLRFPILHPSSKQSPLCDICQERKAFLFCQEDRAILCRECDVPIHKANEHTKKHNRYLITGIKLSTSSTRHPSVSAAASSSSSNQNKNKTKFVENEIFSSSPSADNNSISTSSISEYLETLPGWRVDDFLDTFHNKDATAETSDEHYVNYY